MTPKGSETVELSEDELAFFRSTCDVFPTPESPLRFLDEQDLEPRDYTATFEQLRQRELLSSAAPSASDALRDRLVAVAECSARVRVVEVSDGSKRTRDYYLSNGAAVEYVVAEGLHRFGPARSESALAVELARRFQTAPEGMSRALRMSPGDYLVFAVFARDLRGSEPAQRTDDDTMSVDEVLAYFEEPEGKTIRLPNDESWQASVQALANQRVLVGRAHGYELHPSLHALAREIVADHQHTVTRFDFMDDQWLVREVTLFPTPDSVYRLGTEPDGTVVIHELSASALADVLGGVVGTLPSLLNADVSANLKYSQP